MEVNVTVTLHGLQGYLISRLNATEIELGLVRNEEIEDNKNGLLALL